MASKGRKQAKVLGPRQQRFVDEYLIDLNATQAAIRAGYSAKTAQEQGSRLLSNVIVAEFIQVAQQERSERVQIDADWVLRQWAEIAQGDPNELIQYRRGCCEECWKGEPDKGAHADPNPDCPRCGGEGWGRVHVADTRKLAPRGRVLYAGVKVGKEGIEVKMRDQDGALVNVARHLGMFKDKVELTGKDGGPIRHQNVPPDLSNLTPDELNQLEEITAKLAAPRNA